MSEQSTEKARPSRNPKSPSPAGPPAPTMDPSERANGGTAVASRTGTGPAGEAAKETRGGPIDARALFGGGLIGEPCVCSPEEDCDCNEQCPLHRLTAPDGEEYAVPALHSWVMIRCDSLDLTGIADWSWSNERASDCWGVWWESGRRSPDNIARLLVQTKPAPVRPVHRFRTHAVDALYAAGASIWPCDLKLDHATQPPHVVMLGEDRIGWIMPNLSESNTVVPPDPVRPKVSLTVGNPRFSPGQATP